MRVLVAVEQLRRPVPGGIGRYASSLLDGLAAELAGGGADSVDLLASRGRVHDDPLAHRGFPLHASALPGPLLTRAWDRGLAAAPGGFDVVHSVSLAAPPVRRGAALAVTVHDLAWRRFPETTTARGRRWHEAALHRALRRADALVVPSEPVAEALAGAGGGERVAVLPLGADHLPPPDHPAADALLERLGVAGPYLLSVGTLEPRKNLPRLVAGYAAARPALPGPWPLVVVGPPGWGDGGVTAGLDGDPPQGVVAAGPVADPVLAALYARARLFVYVPLTEGYGLPPLEAMAVGTPVVASSGVPSVAPPGGPPAALVVDPASVGAIAEGLLAAAVDGPLRTTLVERGTALARSRTWRDSARRHLDLWRSLR